MIAVVHIQFINKFIRHYQNKIKNINHCHNNLLSIIYIQE